MNTGARILILSILFIIATCIIGHAAATSLGIDWKQSSYLSGSTFSGAAMTPDGDAVFAGGSQLIYRSWNDSTHWGGQAGFVASMSPDGGWVVSGSGTTATLYDKSGNQMWSRSMGGEIRAVAVAPGATFVLTTDTMGNYITWNRNGELIARNTSDLAKHVAISPKGDLIVVTTERGMRYYNSLLYPLWTDPRDGSLDDYIVISQDGGTIITAGGTRLSSHTAQGALNWQTDVPNAVVNDVACSQDCSLIVTGSQDNAVRGIDRYGKIHWTYKAVQWVNAVAVSSDGGVVAAGINDGNVIILDHNGRMQTEKKFYLRIQPQTLAVSRDGTRIAVADQQYLYGLALHETNGSETPDDTIFVAAPLNPVPKTTTPATVLTTAPPEVTMPEEARPTATATTKASPAGAWIVLPAFAGALLIAGRYRRQ